MKLLDATKKLFVKDERDAALKQLATAPPNAISRDVKHAEPILSNCLRFCTKDLEMGNFHHMSTVFKFVRKTSSDDSWLSSSATVILPQLSGLYCRILCYADPSKSSGGPGKTNITITPFIREQMQVLNTLSSIFELVIDYCDVTFPDAEKTFFTFVKFAAAVLFGSDFQKLQPAFTDTSYAMDQLARCASSALSNLILSFPKLFDKAFNLLKKRIGALLDILHSSPELSTQRSLLLILRKLYGEIHHQNADETLRQEIEDGLSKERFSNGAALKMFQSFDVDNDDVMDKGDVILAAMFESNGLDSRCFTFDCSIRMKGKINGRLKKGGVQKVSADWNRTSATIHFKSQDPAYFPLHALLSVTWTIKQKEVKFSFTPEEDSSERELIIELQPEDKALISKAIDHRTSLIKRKINGLQHSFRNQQIPFQKRKVSDTEPFYRTGPGENLNEAKTQRNKDLEEKDKSRVTGKEMQVDKHVEDVQASILDALGANSVNLGCQDLKGKKKEKEGLKGDNNEDKKRTIFSQMEGDGRLLQGGTQDLEEESDTSSQTESSFSVENLALAESNSNASSPNCSESTNCPSLKKGPQRVGEKEKVNEKNATNSKNKDEALMNESSSLGIHQMSDLQIEQSNEESDDENHTPSGKDSSSGSDYEVPEDYMEMSSGDEVEERTKTHTEGTHDEKVMKEGGKTQTKIGSADEYSEEDSQGGSSMSFDTDDNEIRLKLSHSIGELIKVREKKSLKIRKNIEQAIRKTRSDHAAEDEALLRNFAGIVKEQEEMFRRKVTQSTTKQKNQLMKTSKEVDNLMKSAQGRKESFKTLKSFCMQELAAAKEQIRRAKKQYERDAKKCIRENKSRKKMRTRRDSLFQGIAKLLQES